MAITIELPRDIEERLIPEWPELQRKAIETVVLEGYRHGLISQGQLQEALNLSFAEAEAILAAREIDLPYDEEELEEDRAAFRPHRG